VKITATFKDFILLIGIVIAIITSVITWYHFTNPPVSKMTPVTLPKSSTGEVIKKLSKTFFTITKAVKDHTR